MNPSTSINRKYTFAGSSDSETCREILPVPFFCVSRVAVYLSEDAVPGTHTVYLLINLMLMFLLCLLDYSRARQGPQGLVADLRGKQVNHL